uniref:Uncharacterized protein n=1 Tax=Cacopsylla melanoneura TaxID=428564 RepID=A0A8D9A8T3_9HEMI
MFILLIFILFNLYFILFFLMFLCLFNFLILLFLFLFLPPLTLLCQYHLKECVSMYVLFVWCMYVYVCVNEYVCMVCVQYGLPVVSTPSYWSSKFTFQLLSHCHHLTLSSYSPR